jgi:hypothetical protein
MTSLYHPGYGTAREKVLRMTLDQLLEYIDALWGRDNLRYGATEDEVRAEALSQCDREFRNAEAARDGTLAWINAIADASKRGTLR